MLFRSQSGESLCYTECAEAGASSAAVYNIMAGVYLVNEMNRPARHDDLHLARLERYVNFSQRLKNDLFSAPKERVEGRVSNTVIAMERVLSAEDAFRFVEQQKLGYDRLIQKTFQLLGEDDPYVGLYRRLIAGIDRWYRMFPVRYQTHLQQQDMQEPLSITRGLGAPP